MAKPVTPAEHVAAARDELTKMRDLVGDNQIGNELDQAIAACNRAIAGMDEQYAAAMRAAYGPKA